MNVESGLRLAVHPLYCCSQLKRNPEFHTEYTSYLTSEQDRMLIAMPTTSTGTDSAFGTISMAKEVYLE
jgi:hypothetical protein